MPLNKLNPHDAKLLSRFIDNHREDIGKIYKFIGDKQMKTLGEEARRYLAQAIVNYVNSEGRRASVNKGEVEALIRTILPTNEADELIRTTLSTDTAEESGSQERPEKGYEPMPGEYDAFVKEIVDIDRLLVVAMPKYGLIIMSEGMKLQQEIDSALRTIVLTLLFCGIAAVTVYSAIPHIGLQSVMWIGGGVCTLAGTIMRGLTHNTPPDPKQALIWGSVAIGSIPVIVILEGMRQLTTAVRGRSNVEEEYKTLNKLMVAFQDEVIKVHPRSDSLVSSVEQDRRERVMAAIKWLR